MKLTKKSVFLVLLFMVIGFAAVNTVLEINGNVSLAYDEDDFKINISNVLVNGEARVDLISEDKQSFTYVKEETTDTLEEVMITYVIENASYKYDADIELICNPSEAVNINQVNIVEAQSRKRENITTNLDGVTCSINIKNIIGRSALAEAMCPYDIGETWDFSYVGHEEDMDVLCSGEYKLEVWGAQGGDATDTYTGGYGGYSTGSVMLNSDNHLYINVGGKGASNKQSNMSDDALGGYNGGGTSTANSAVNHVYGTGGGATHIALKSGELYTLENNLSDILIVSGGGGGGRWQSNYVQGCFGYGGHGGGIYGGYGSLSPNNSEDIDYEYTGGGTQSGYLPGTLDSGSESFFGSFGKGAGTIANGSGGGGFYGGNANGSGGGGSGYIGNPLLTSKAMYCYNCFESSDEETKTISTTNVSEMPVVNSAKKADGYARVTYLGK